MKNILYFLTITINIGLVSCMGNHKGKIEDVDCLNIPDINTIVQSDDFTKYNLAMSIFDEERLDRKINDVGDTLIRIFIGKRFQTGIIVTIQKTHSCENYIIKLKEVPDIDSKIVNLKSSLRPENIVYQTNKRIFRAGRPLNVNSLLKFNKSADSTSYLDGTTCFIEWKIGSKYSFAKHNLSSDDVISLPIKNFITQFYSEKIDVLNKIF